jgi:hypothetical protein
MPRQARLDVPGTLLHHVIVRGTVGHLLKKGFEHPKSN